jgi:ribosome-associated protein
MRTTLCGLRYRRQIGRPPLRHQLELPQAFVCGSFFNALPDDKSNHLLGSSGGLPFGHMYKIKFELEGEYVELNQLLKLVGACDSGGQGKQLVAEGLVRVDGNVELRKTCKIRIGQVVAYENLLIHVTDRE